ncbi:MAG: sensor histidine kinase [Lachnospiraceae bacterium]
MDTKLKNRHSIAVILMILVVLLPSIGMIWMYPFFEGQVIESNNDREMDEEFLYGITRGNFVLYVEGVQQEAEGVSSLLDIFYPNAKDTESVTDDDSDLYAIANTMRNDLYSTFDVWSSNFSYIRDFVDYQMVDAEGKTRISSVPGINMKASIDADDYYVFSVKISYDAGGNATVTAGKGNHSAAAVTAISKIVRDLPLLTYPEAAEDYGDVEYSTDYMENWEFQNPQNCTFYYGMTQEQYASYFENDSYWSFNSYWRYSSLVPISFIFMGIVAVLALLLPCIPGMSLGEKRIFQVSAEPVLFILAVALGAYAGDGMVLLTRMGNEQRVFHALRRLNFPSFLAEGCSFLWHLFWWALLFGIVYWSITCLRAVFTLGIRRYWKERTWIYKIYAWVKRQLIKLYQSFSNFDFRDNGNKMLLKIVGVNFLALILVCVMWVFGITVLIIYSVVLFFILRNYMTDLQKKYNRLLEGTSAIAEGNLDVNIEEDLGIFNPLKGELQKVQKGFKKAVEEEVKSQKMKTDLISNVSHDLKTPLTAIITYVNLLKNENITDEQRRSYVDILDQKSLRLKVLIEDLFEVSKATSNNVTLHFAEVDVVELLKQVSYELSDKMEESSLDFRWRLPDEKIMVSLDSQKTYRVFENLLTNIIKYSMPHTRAYIQIETQGEQVVITMKNISAGELEFDPEDITERFVRGDASRNTEGSGLGLAIAKSFTELQHGQMKIEVDADLFTVKISWPYTEKKSLVQQFVNMI